MNGKILWQKSYEEPKRVISEYNVGAMNDMLKTAIEVGTGKRAMLPHHQAGGKTGTTQQAKDAWFIGYTSHLVAGIWIGNDDNTPTKHTSGGGLPAIMWKNIMLAAHKGITPKKLPGKYYHQEELDKDFWDNFTSIFNEDNEKNKTTNKKRKYNSIDEIIMAPR